MAVRLSLEMAIPWVSRIFSFHHRACWLELVVALASLIFSFHRAPWASCDSEFIPNWSEEALLQANSLDLQLRALKYVEISWAHDY